MRRIKNQAELLKFMEKEHQQLFQSGFAVAGAHGTGLGTCATVWKDYASSPQYQRAGVLFIIFGAGLVSAILNCAVVFSMLLWRSENRTSLYINRPLDELVVVSIPLRGANEFDAPLK